MNISIYDEYITLICINTLTKNKKERFYTNPGKHVRKSMKSQGIKVGGYLA